MKLWQKDNTDVSNLVETFTVGRDKEFDLLLAKHDVQGSIAHVSMLAATGLLDDAEANQAIAGLQEIMHEIECGTFRIEEGIEDVHSQVEFMLTKKIGDAGKKIHSGRSRNDQVAVDIKLYLREQVKQIKDDAKKVFDLFIQQSNANKHKLIPGYTHLQIAMPSSAGMWLGAYAESLVDDLQLLSSAYKMVNKNPLGSGAGYGSSFPLNRKMTTGLLQFSALHHNSVYAQMSRGKTEKFVAIGMAAIAATLSKFSMDCTLYLSQNFSFISFPESLTTGSSIMPHKKNPDVFELIRAKCNRLQAVPNELTLLINNLPSGYHRDMQLTKEVLFPAIEELKSCLQMMQVMLQNIHIKDDLLKDEKYLYLFSVEKVNELVLQGVPFRDAYRQVGNAINDGTFSNPLAEGKALNHTHEGSIGNLCNEEIVQEMDRVVLVFGE